jgi:hypothetical protein
VYIAIVTHPCPIYIHRVNAVLAAECARQIAHQIEFVDEVGEVEVEEACNFGAKTTELCVELKI